MNSFKVCLVLVLVFHNSNALEENTTEPKCEDGRLQAIILIQMVFSTILLAMISYLQFSLKQKMKALFVQIYNLPKKSIKQIHVHQHKNDNTICDMSLPHFEESLNTEPPTGEYETMNSLSNIVYLSSP